ncbi:hypothetical protein [Formosa sp. A9]|uniref:hypothetical protein n=1 Tax=Formosa sp. A9 TaxID=3442641 RepID=UPI003EBA60A1
MKSLRITFFALVLFGSLTSCVKEDLEDDDVLVAPDDVEATYYTGGVVDEK